jgi:hypothetical protein
MEAPPVTSIPLYDVDRLASYVANTHDSPDWLAGWVQDILACRHRRTHLAVMSGPYLERILDGTKTIESRFMKNRTAPYGQVGIGDVIFFKPTCSPIIAAGLVGEVLHLDISTFSLEKIAERYGAAIAPADETFWVDRVNARYATLMTMVDAVSISPLSINKRDRRGWVVLNQLVEQESLF